MCHGFGVELRDYPAHLDRSCAEYNGPVQYMMKPYIGEGFDRINEKNRQTLHQLRYHCIAPQAAKQAQVCPYWWQGRGCRHFGRCPARHPAFEDGYPIWKENICPHFQVDQCDRGANCKMLHLTWDQYLARTEETQDAWTDWMHMAAEQRGKMGPPSGDYPVIGPDWFNVDTNQDDLFRWRGRKDDRRTERDKTPARAPFNTFTRRSRSEGPGGD